MNRRRHSDVIGERNLMAAVVRQAVHDLTPTADVTEFGAAQAARFLMDIVWKPGCWCGAATRLLATDEVDRMVARRLPPSAWRRLSDPLQARLTAVRGAGE